MDARSRSAERGLIIERCSWRAVPGPGGRCSCPGRGLWVQLIPFARPRTPVRAGLGSLPNSVVTCTAVPDALARQSSTESSRLGATRLAVVPPSSALWSHSAVLAARKQHYGSILLSRGALVSSMAPWCASRPPLPLTGRLECVLDLDATIREWNGTTARRVAPGGGCRRNWRATASGTAVRTTTGFGGEPNPAISTG